jgi:hypothetical protein
MSRTHMLLDRPLTKIIADCPFALFGRYHPTARYSPIDEILPAAINFKDAFGNTMIKTKVPPGKISTTGHNPTIFQRDAILRIQLC